MIDKSDDIRGLDLVWVDKMERSAVQWFPDDSVFISPAEHGEVTVKRGVAADGKPELTVTSEKTAKDARKYYIAETTTEHMRRLIDELDRGPKAQHFWVDEEEGCED